jgi:hypothetical protein
LERIMGRRRRKTYTEDGNIDVTAANHAKGLARVEARCAGDECRRLLACVDNVSVEQVYIH